MKVQTEEKVNFFFLDDDKTNHRRIEFEITEIEDAIRDETREFVGSGICLHIKAGNVSGTISAKDAIKLRRLLNTCLPQIGAEK